MRLLCSMGQRDSAVSYTIVSNKNYMHWYRIIVYSCMTCGFDRLQAIKRDVSHMTKHPRLSTFQFCSRVGEPGNEAKLCSSGNY